MSFRRTPAEIDEIVERLRNPEFTNAQVLQVDFRTTADALADALPPGVQASPECRGYARVGRWTSNCVGSFSGSSIAVEATVGSYAGHYVLAMYMDTNPPIVFGRELFGEPKRFATTGLFPTSSGWFAYMERNGSRLLEIELEDAVDLGPTTVDSATFNVKATFEPDGSGLIGDALVTQSRFTNELTSVYKGAGRLRVEAGPHDPFDALPVVELLGARYSEGRSKASTTVVGRISGPEFLPFALARIDDPRRLDTSR